ncbi:MAG: DNA-directed RNA polymerase subunit A' [Candidatus Heimdallarchaeota archaeon LC_2]|nr:MAG: DNA-directed RNA polymerase subunit A' [Candidatus Heimdallarchaeota archaeon LC_2]
MSVSQLPKAIKKIRLGLLSPDEIRRMSVERILTADTFDEDGSPIATGLMDSALGTIDPGQRCATCENRIGGCPGHFGHIELQRPVVHVGFNKIIYKILQVICGTCSKIMLPQDEIIRDADKLRKTKLANGVIDLLLIEDIWKRAKRNRDQLINPRVDEEGKTRGCYHCEAFQNKIRLEKPTTYYVEYETADGNKVSDRLTALDVQNKLKRIPADDALLLGVDTKYARPEWMILEVLPVPPVAVRPSITLDSGIRSEDDLTHKLVDIIRINQRLQDNRESGAPQLIVEDLWELLQYHITTYFDNEVSGIPPARHRSGRALRTITQRLKGKEGRFRSNLSGKRVDFSARTVISPDPLLSINEVGVPKAIAEILTVPERVTEWNIEEMKELVMRGPRGHPGVNYIIRDDGRRVDLRFVRDPTLISDSLRPGFTVERHLRDGDVVLFNRQPSLHRMSIMAHRVRVMPYKTFRLNLCVCRPYNADFDGDEMNLHVPQSEESRAEANILMLVQEQISTPRYGGPIIGAIQDFITAAYLFTKNGTMVNRQIASELVTAAGVDNLPEPDAFGETGEPMWSGKILFSTLLPAKLNYVMKNKFCETPEICTVNTCPHEGFVQIINGKLIKGIIDKEGFGAEVSNSVLHRILKEFGPVATRIFLDGITKMLSAYITRWGFSMGLDDVDVSDAGRVQIKALLDGKKARVDELVQEFHDGKLERAPGQTLKDTLEAEVQNVLSQARDEAAQISGDLIGLENEAVIMARTGARGSYMNLGQMSACVGQQSVRGNRIERGYSGRTLPHFRRGDLSARGKGFVDSSFRSGLNAIEYFMHACGGREGLVDTAVRTSSSGYMQRRLVNAMQDLSSQYDKTVRNSTGAIIQFQFGDDNIDPAKSDHGKAVNIDVLMNKILENEDEIDQ